MSVKSRFIGIVLTMGFLLFPESGEAQCAMCRAVLESNDNTAVAEGINKGIVYLMAIPYLLVAVLGFIVYRKMRSQ